MLPLGEPLWFTTVDALFVFEGPVSLRAHDYRRSFAPSVPYRRSFAPSVPYSDFAACACSGFAAVPVSLRAHCYRSFAACLHLLRGV